MMRVLLVVGLVASCGRSSRTGPAPETLRQQALDGVYESLFAEGTQKEQAGDHQGAVDCFRAALAAVPEKPKSATAWNDLGWSLFQLGRHQDAAAAFTRAVQLRPDFQMARNNLAMAENALQHGKK